MYPIFTVSEEFVMHWLKNGIIRDSVKTLFLLILFTLIAYVFHILTAENTSIAIVYILCVLLVSRLTSGYTWGIIASLFGVIGVNYLFTYPFLELNFSLSGYPVTFIGMLTISLITSTLTTHIKQQAKMTALREESLNKLNKINKQLLMADSISQIIELVLHYVVSSYKVSCIFYTDDPIRDLAPVTKMVDGEDEDIFSSYAEKANAHLAYITQVPMGLQHSEMTSACLYLPITSHGMIRGILGLSCKADPDFEQNHLSFLRLMLPQVALAFERQTLSDNHQRLAIENEKEKMRANLLRAISHDLRTPLTSMIGASATYLENTMLLDESEKTELITHIHEDSNWLLHMVENLLSVTRIDKGTAKVKKTLEPLEEVISESISRVKKRYSKASIKVSVPDEFIMVPMDATLIEQVIINLIENALKYAHSTQPIELSATKEDDIIKVQVLDYGVGIRKDRLNTLFDGYSSNPNESSDASKGMGIGLSICKTIIRAHSGDIWAKNLEQGAAFTFTLPLEGDDYCDQ